MKRKDFAPASGLTAAGLLLIDLLKASQHKSPFVCTPLAGRKLSNVTAHANLPSLSALSYSGTSRNIDLLYQYHKIIAALFQNPIR